VSSVDTTKNKYVIVFGSNELASFIIRDLIIPHETNVIVIDFNDPEQIYNNPDLEGVKNILVEKIRHEHISELDINELKKLLINIDVANIDSIILCNSSQYWSKKYLSRNIQASEYIDIKYNKHILNILGKLGYKNRLIHLSTALVYGNNGISNENTECKPTTKRGIRRFKQEQQVIELSKQYGIKYTILRLGTVYSGYMPSDRAINTFAQNVLSNDSIIIFGSGLQTRDFISVRDVSELVTKMALMDSKDNRIDNQIFNVGGNIKELHVDDKTHILSEGISITGLAQAMLARIRRYNPQCSTTIIYKKKRSDEDDVKITLDCRKIFEIMGYVNKYDLVRTLDEVILFNAYYRLQYDNSTVSEIKRRLKELSVEGERKLKEEQLLSEDEHT